MLSVDTDLSRATPVDTGSSVEAADVALAAHLAKNKDDPAVRTVGALSEVGDQWPLVALSGALLASGAFTGDRRAVWAGTRMLASLALATAIKTGLKNLVARTRPNVLLDEGRYDVELFGPDGGAWHSFPSGHTAGSVAVARAVGRVYPSARPAAYVSAAAVALAQIPRGAHYPSDVAAGALIGLVAEVAIDRLARRLADKNDLDGRRRVFEEPSEGRGRSAAGIHPQDSAPGRSGAREVTAATAGRGSLPPRP